MWVSPGWEFVLKARLKENVFFKAKDAGRPFYGQWRYLVEVQNCRQGHLCCTDKLRGAPFAFRDIYFFSVPACASVFRQMVLLKNILPAAQATCHGTISVVQTLWEFQSFKRRLSSPAVMM